MSGRHTVELLQPPGCHMRLSTGTHTQGVEAMWSSCKHLMREERTMHTNLFDIYLPEFMWRRRFIGPETFSNIVMHIVEQYTV